MVHRISKQFTRILFIALAAAMLAATLVRTAPGFGVSDEELDPRLNSESIRAIRQQHSVNLGLASFYFNYFRSLAHGDLGVSSTFHRPVAELIGERLPVTAKSMGAGLLMGWLLGLCMGAVSVTRVPGLGFWSNLVSGVFLCFPAAVVGMLLVLARAPTRFAIALIIFPRVYAYTRNLLRQAYALPHVAAVQARGIKPLRIFCYHVLPPAAPQLFASLAVSVSLAFSASVPVEVVCDLAGVGQLAWQAAMGRDIQLLVSLTLLVTMVVVVTNSLSEALTPRRLEEAVA